jgi:hypothetical protein
VRFLCKPGLAVLAAVTGLALVIGAQPCQASMVTFLTPTGATTSGGPVNASAVFTTSAGQLTITLTNLQANITDIAQALSAISFTLSSGSLSPSSSNNPTVNLINIVNNVGVPAGTGPAGWAYSSTATAGNENDLAAGGAGPQHLIIGPGPYTNANGSINNNGPHNPFINQTVTWTITGANISANTTVTAATFQFGTALLHEAR